MAHADHRNSRRAFLGMLAASPALPYLTGLSGGILRAFEQGPYGQFVEGSLDGSLISTPDEAITVFDFETVAKKKLHAGHVSYLAGTEDEGTYRANREGFDRYQLRVRRLVDISKIDMSVSLFGTKWATPILLCPCGGQKAFDPDGEVAAARAAKAKGHLQALSTVASRSIEDVTAARGAPIWFQLYANNDWNKTRAMVKRAEAAGSPAMAFTIDSIGGGKRVVMARARRANRSLCQNCHQLQPQENLSNLAGSGFVGGSHPMEQTPPLGPPMIDESSPTWDYVKRLKDATSMKLLVKGVVTSEDAELALQHGVDGIWISNHGGRAENSLRGTIESVAEVSAAVNGRVPVIVDGGFRRGTDIYKALALGATAVGVGRPYLYGLASFGQPGVEAVLDILDTELRMVMRQAGTPSVAKITKAAVIDRYTLGRAADESRRTGSR